MPPAGWLLIAATALILVAGWCAAAHDAMIRADPDGLETYGGLLTLIRVGAEVSAAVLVTLAFAHWLGGGWQVFLPAAGALLVATYVLIGVGPRPLSKQRAEKMAGTATALLRPLRRALGPLPGLLNRLTGVLPLVVRGADPEFGGRPEVRSLVDYIEGQAEIEPGERDMVRSVFELGDTIVREVMVPRTDMVFIERDKTLDQALSLALRSGFSRIPVVGESIDDVVGIAYLKDVVAWEQEHPDADETLAPERIEKVMRPATYVPDSKPVDELLRQMQSMRIHVAIVIDEYGGTAGLVTIEDILEEIVGEIADEYDTERAPVEWLAPGTARVTARLPVTELEELFGVTVDAEDVETVGGLLAHELGRVPIAGADATVAGLRLTAENLAGRRNKLGTVLVQRVDAESELSRTGPCLRPSALTTLIRVSEAPLDPEDEKIITLARSTRARTGSAEGAAVRDETGRTYTAASVALPSLRLSALRLAVAMAASSGAERLEAAALVSDSDPDPADLAAVRDLGPDAPVFRAAPDGTLRAIN
jgi:CBS domain containing-hemolysin-like protein